MPQGGPPPAPPPMPQHMREGGLADLPVHNIGKDYASGGIVAFDEGGNIQNELTADQYFDKLEAPNAPARMAHGGGIKHYADGDVVRGGPYGVQALTTPVGANGVPMLDYDEYGRPLNMAIDESGNLHNLGLVPDIGEYGSLVSRSGRPLNDVEKEYAMSPYLTHPTQRTQVLRGFDATSPPIPPAAAAPPAPPAPSPASVDYSKYLRGGDDSGSFSARSTTKGTRLQPNKDDSFDPNSLIVKADDLGTEIDQIMKYNEKYGVKAGFNKLNDLMDRQEQSLTSDKQSAKKMAMAQAGFAMMRQASIRGGEHGYGGQGLGGLFAAAGAGGEEYTKDMLSAMDKYRQGMNQLMGDRIKAQLGVSQNDAQMIRDGVMGHRDSVRLQAQTTADAARIIGERETRASAERIAAMHDATLRGMYGQKVKPEDQVIAGITRARAAGDTKAEEGLIGLLKNIRATAPAVQTQGLKDVSGNTGVSRAYNAVLSAKPGTAEYDAAFKHYQDAIRLAQMSAGSEAGGAELPYPG
jgi:hypothetical protein